MLSSAQFGGGKGLDVHIRTKHRHHFSFITSAAVRIGDEVFEVTDRKDDPHYLNGVANAELPNKLSGYKITHKQDNAKQHTYHIVVGGRENIVIRVLKDFVTVTIKHGEFKDFDGAVGLMGAYPSGAWVGRDGKTIFTDANAFGQEWQVLDTQPMIFQGTVAPQHPMQCIPPPPKSVKRRRLGENEITQEMAEAACADVPEDDRDFCIFDVLATNDVEMAGSY